MKAEDWSRGTTRGSLFINLYL